MAQLTDFAQQPEVLTVLESPTGLCRGWNLWCEVVEPVAGWAWRNKVDVGIALGGVSFVAGLAGVFAIGAFAAEDVGITLGAVAAVAGILDLALDARACLAHFELNGICTAAVLGALGLGLGVPEFLVGAGAITEGASKLPLFFAYLGAQAAGLAVVIDGLLDIYDMWTKRTGKCV